MRRLVPVVTVLALGWVSESVAQTGNADAVMAAARAALGGDAKIAAVKTFIATGRTRQVRGENLVPIEFEIQAELPDKYSRHDEFPAQDAGPVTAGFAGDALVLIPRPVPPPPRPGAPAPPPGAQEAMLRARLNGAKQDFVRLLLGMFAGSTAALPLTYSYVGQAEAPQGKADVVDIKGPNDFAARLFIAGDTKLPIMLSWTAPQGPQGTPGAQGAQRAQGAQGATGAQGAPGAAPAPSAPGGPPAPGAPSAPGAPRAPGAPVEQRLFFADYRDVDGLKLPFRIRRAAGSETTEETTFDRYRINVRIDPRRFDTSAK